jgi:uncharacterized protein (DUF169 family)
MEKWLQIGKKIRTFINPATFPVAVKFLNEEGKVPASTRRPYKNLNVRMAPCQGAAIARRYGWTIAFGKDDVGCAIAAHTYGWDRVVDDSGAISFLTYMNYAADERAARELLAGFRQLEIGGNLIVVYSPLEWTKIEPDVVLIYVNPAQLMRLIHGVTHRSGKPIGSSFSGRAASCTEGLLGAYLDNAPKVVVPGNGDRVWAGCQDHEMLMAIPGTKLSELVDGLEKTHQQGIRYPIPTYLRYEPEIKLSLPLSDAFKPDAVERIRK